MFGDYVACFEKHMELGTIYKAPDQQTTSSVITHPIQSAQTNSEPTCALMGTYRTNKPPAK